MNNNSDDCDYWMMKLQNLFSEMAYEKSIDMKYEKTIRIFDILD